MTSWFNNLRSQRDLEELLEDIGCDKGALPYFQDRSRCLALRIQKVDARAANILKQEMLSRGGDVAVHRGVVDHQVAHSDVAIFGSFKQLGYLAQKLKTMAYWGLDEVRREILASLEGISKRKHLLSLPGGRTMTLGEKPLLMGILNLTDDSFYKGSRVSSKEECLKKAASAIEAGADILDLGAESTRPGSLSADEKTEKDRLIPAVRAIRENFKDIPISIDTQKAQVARECVQSGADIINDISGLGFDPSMAETAADLGVPLVLMHIKGTPRTMQEDPSYGCLPGEMMEFFENRISEALKAGVKREQIILDPGIGFGKTKDHNFALLSHLEYFRALGLPILVGHSRKSFLKDLRDQGTPEGRLEGTLAATAILAWQRADVIRVHDVLPNRKVLDTIEALARN